jgi:hypothetical protein
LIREAHTQTDSPSNVENEVTDYVEQIETRSIKEKEMKASPENEATDTNPLRNHFKRGNAF